jgi:hypothetical protein
MQTQKEAYHARLCFVALGLYQQEQVGIAIICFELQTIT